MNLEGSSNLTVSEPNVDLQVWDTPSSQSVYGFGSYTTEFTPRLETYFTTMADKDLVYQEIEAAIVLSEEALDIGRRPQCKNRRTVGATRMLAWEIYPRQTFI